MVTLQGTATLDPTVNSVVTVSSSWIRQGSTDLLSFDESTAGPYTTGLVIGPLSAGGMYVFTVTVSPSNPTYVRSTPRSFNTNYTLSIQPYPPLVIRKTVRVGECMVNDTATLTGNINLLPNTATNRIMTFTWMDPDGRPITTSNRAMTVSEGVLVLRNLRENKGNYSLMACLTIPGTDVSNHCSTAEYDISTDVPGHVEDLSCPSSPDGGVLNIIWQQPSINRGSVNDYVVVVQEYMGNQTELFQQEVQSGGALMITVSSGMEGFVPYYVTVMPRNPAGCGEHITIVCFTQAGGVPTSLPSNIIALHPRGDLSIVNVTWQPFTLVEARGFINYTVQLYIAEQDELIITQQVPSTQSSVIFTGLDTTRNYEATVGTISLSDGKAGPVSGRIRVTDSAPPTVTAAIPSRSSESSLVIAVSVLGILIVVVLVPIIVIVVMLSRSRRIALKLRRELNYTRISKHEYEEIAIYSQIPEEPPEPDYDEVNDVPDREQDRRCRHLPTVQVVVDLHHEYEHIERNGAKDTQRSNGGELVSTGPLLQNEPLQNACMEASAIHLECAQPVPVNKGQVAVENYSTALCCVGGLEPVPNEDGHNHVSEQASDIDIAQRLSDAQELSEDDTGDQVKIYDASSLTYATSVNDGHYECVPNVNLNQVLSAAGEADLYERVPNVNLAQILSSIGCQSQIYERVPNVNIAEILSSQSQIYERVPNVNIAEILSSIGRQAQIYERVPNVDIAQILAEVSNSDNERNVYERVQYSERTLQLIRGIMRPYEQISGYERVRYSEAIEQMFQRTCGEGATEQSSGYERVRYSETMEQMLQRTCGEGVAEQSSGYETVQYSETIGEVLTVLNPNFLKQST